METFNPEYQELTWWSNPQWFPQAAQPHLAGLFHIAQTNLQLGRDLGQVTLRWQHSASIHI